MYDSYQKPINPVLFIGGLVTLLVLLCVVPLVSKAEHVQTRVIHICTKGAVANGGSNEYRIYAAEGTFVLKDSYLVQYRTNTADVYPRIKTHAAYQVVTKGFRWGLMSWFPNILKLHYLPNDKKSDQLCAGFS